MVPYSILNAAILGLFCTSHLHRWSNPITTVFNTAKVPRKFIVRSVDRLGYLVEQILRITWSLARTKVRVFEEFDSFQICYMNQPPNAMQINLMLLQTWFNLTVCPWDKFVTGVRWIFWYARTPVNHPYSSPHLTSRSFQRALFRAFNSNTRL